MDTAQAYGHCTDLWTMHRLMDTVQTYGHCTDLWTLHRLMDTAQTYGHCTDLWTHHSSMYTMVVGIQTFYWCVQCKSCFPYQQIVLTLSLIESKQSTGLP